jgi:septal ring factor EnvC (AmiA/AmiB activator)
MRDVEKLRLVEGEVRLLCESQEKCRSVAGELALLRQAAEQKRTEVDTLQALLTEALSAKERLSIPNGQLMEELVRLKVKNSEHADAERKEDDAAALAVSQSPSGFHSQKVRHPRRPLAAVSRRVRFVCRLQGLLCPPVAGR